MSIRDGLLEAIERSGETRYRIAKDAKIEWKVLDEFINRGRDVQLSTVEQLADYFGMRLTKPSKHQGK